MTEPDEAKPPPDLRRKSLLNPDTKCDICGGPFAWVFSAPNHGHEFATSLGEMRRARCLAHLYTP